ncbi:hypothetical protein [Parasphingorhabdus sp.]|jgi:hypothetical protein|uniref:hypothetical protein n=1 Tax=Parasphingorhabdus sp. TaxID=2709688 RepID=UPI0007F516C1|nr:hypothetical protein A8B75_00905 [Sphingomonadales bacterium EhC05]
MKNMLPIFTALLIAGSSSPAFADSSLELHDIIAASPAPMIEAVDLPFSSFDLTDHDKGDSQFMATMSEQFQPGFRLLAESKALETEELANPLGLIFPGELAYRSRSQDTGVDSIVPGRFLSNSVRADYLADSGPAAADKNAIGIRIGF